MKDMKRTFCTALFDFDGVVMDTETCYTRFWTEVGIRYFNDPHFGKDIKGQTLTRIYDRYFSGPLERYRDELTEALNRFEEQMVYTYILGAEQFVADLRVHGVHTAVVTSSDANKMSKVYRQHPEILHMFDEIIMSGMFVRSKPAPDCFLQGMACFGSTPQQTVVFEDSIYGLQAGKASGAFVVGLSTTYPADRVKELSDAVIPHFGGFTYDKMLEMLQNETGEEC